MVRHRSISSIIGRPSRPESARKKKDKKAKIPCYCSKCNGKLVLKRTKLFHDAESSLTVREDTANIQRNEGVSSVNTQREGQSSVRIQHDEDPDIGLPHSTVSEYRVTRKRSKRYESPQIEQIDMSDSEDDRYVELSENSEDSDEYEPSLGESILDFGEKYEDYSSPRYEPCQHKAITIDEKFAWILLWIMNFRIRFNIPQTATESLIKFMKLVLTEIGGKEFSNFPDSLYKAKELLNMEDQFHCFVPCKKCHKLYNKDDVVNFRKQERSSIMKCNHIEFPNSTHRNARFCNAPLSRYDSTPLSRGTDSIKPQPELIFPFAGIRQQLTVMFRREGFENSLRHWANRTGFNNILTDIYDGQVWKTFKETSDRNSPNFFHPDVADSNLGLMLNLDWFQPYDGTVHSTGVIYAAICNLPRDIRFRRENMLILGILPGPNEVQLHKINHYLAPIVDELASLWSGITLNRTYEHSEGKIIRAALILVSCDIPAARKICGHVSALVSCHRCKKKANYENGQHNFAGMNDLDEWNVPRDLAQHREDALGWRRCNSDAARKRFVKETGVRWSELLRLPYFDPIRFLTVDPMHCLFLGIAKWIVKRIWVDEKILTPEVLKKIQRNMNQFHVPADLGRIPRKIDCGEGFSNFTADQWRNFITIYATVLLWEHLPIPDRKILTYFVRVCSTLVCRILEIDSIREANEKLIEIVKLIEENYGRDKISPNLHLSLHLRECSQDFGPLYTFWCFSFERMNGLLGIRMVLFY
jgi:hypothetical protein